MARYNFPCDPMRCHFAFGYHWAWCHTRTIARNWAGCACSCIGRCLVQEDIIAGKSTVGRAPQAEQKVMWSDEYSPERTCANVDEIHYE